MRYIVGGLLGAGCGYLASILAANLEEFQFLRVRQWVTGKTAMSEIIHQPADKWIIPVVVSIFALCGAWVGVLIVWQFQIGKKGGRKDRE